MQRGLHVDGAFYVDQAVVHNLVPGQVALQSELLMLITYLLGLKLGENQFREHAKIDGTVL